VRVRQMSVRAFAAAALALLLAGCGVPLDSWDPPNDPTRTPLTNGCQPETPIAVGPEDCQADWPDVEDPTHMYVIR